MARPNYRGRQVVSFFTTGKRAAIAYGLPDYIRTQLGRYSKLKISAINAVNEVAVPTATAMIVRNYTIPESRLRGRVRIASSPDKFRLFASSLRFPLSLFNGRWGGHGTAGATAEIVRGREKTYAHAFIAPGRFAGSKIPMIFVRKDGKKVRMQHGRYTGYLRQPIIALRGPSTFQMIKGTDQGGTENWIDLRDALAEKLRTRFLSAIKDSSDG